MKKPTPVASDDAVSVRQVHVSLSLKVNIGSFSSAGVVAGLTEPYRIQPGENPTEVRQQIVDSMYADLEEALADSVMKLKKKFSNLFKEKE